MRDTAQLSNLVRNIVPQQHFFFLPQGFDYKTCSLMSCLEQQSPNIAEGVHVNRSEEDIGAGDQVLMSMTSAHTSSNHMVMLSAGFLFFTALESRGGFA